MPKIILRTFVVLLIGFVSGVIGWIVGALIGGNYAEQFVFNGVRGYEATGQLGFIFGTLIGLILSWWFLFKKNRYRYQDNLFIFQQDVLQSHISCLFLLVKIFGYLAFWQVSFMLLPKSKLCVKMFVRLAVSSFFSQ